MHPFCNAPRDSIVAAVPLLLEPVASDWDSGCGACTSEACAARQSRIVKCPYDAVHIAAHFPAQPAHCSLADCSLPACPALPSADVRLHTHLAENAEDISFVQATYGCGTSEFIAKVGWDQPDVWFAHCVMLTPGDMEQFAAKGLGVCHCPASNLRTGALQPAHVCCAAGRLGRPVSGTALIEPKSHSGSEASS
jgi:cytosine/adenosine deaminase-related metal-dependent hydrolase